MAEILFAALAFVFMEFVAWTNHKFVMHGFLWNWHKDHHINDHKKAGSFSDYHPGLEKNDLFFLIYALPAIIFLAIGLWFQLSLAVALGVGISLYGLIYFIIHDIIIHERINMPFLMKLKRNKFIHAVVEAHMAHHRGKNIRDFSNYGLLFFRNRQ